MPGWTVISRRLNLTLARSAVGDRYVLEEMAKGGFNVGGEQSGHIILSDFSTTGDGLIAALQVLAVLAQEGKPASEAAHLFEPLPQVLENVRFKKGSPLDDARVKSSIDAANAKLGDIGPGAGAQVRHRAPDPGDGGRRGRKDWCAPWCARSPARSKRSLPSDPCTRLLVIAGSDSSAGAGIQADLKTAQAFGVYAQTAVTAVTVQDTKGVRRVHPVPPRSVRGQIEAALGDIGADAIKIGMLGNGRDRRGRGRCAGSNDIPLVLDPVLLSSSGAPLLDEAGIAVLKNAADPRATLVTPNLPEAEALTGI